MTVQFLETPITHVCDQIIFEEGSGCTSKAEQPPIQEPCEFTLIESDEPVQLIQKNGSVALMQKDLKTLHTEGRARGSDLDYPANSTFDIKGSVAVPSQRFNARYIEINVGNAQRKSVSIYRALHATKVGASGCLAGTVENENGVEPWALLTLTVTPTIGAPLVFVAQADAYGDFVLPVNDAPALDKDAPAETYPADLVIQRVAIEPGTQLPNPDDLADLDIESLTIENSFAAHLSFPLVPGKKNSLASAGKTTVFVRPNGG